MRPALRITVSVLVALGWSAFATGCRTLSVRVDEPGDISRYRTWDFYRPPLEAARAPLRSGIDFESVVAEQIETGLSDRGFRRATVRPGLLVHFQLGIREQLVEQYVTGAIEHLPSLHSAPSFDVQRTRTERKRYEIADLRVSIIDSRTRSVVWRGRLNERYLDAFAPHLDEAVSELLGHLPRPRPSTNGRTLIAKEGALSAPIP